MPGRTSTRCARNWLTRSRPANQIDIGGISSTASARSSSVSAGHVRRLERGRRNASAGPAASGRRARRCRPRPAPGVAICARARCSALLAAAVEVPSRSATSAACQPSTSRRISTARWRGGRYCSAAMSASRVLARAATTAAGSSAPRPVSAVRDRLQPRNVQKGDGNGAVRVLGRRAQPGRQGPPGPGFQRAEACVRRDPVQPGTHRGPAFEVAVGSPRAQQSLLHLVLGVVHGAEHAVAVGQQLASVGIGQLCEILAARRCPGGARHGSLPPANALVSDRSVPPGKLIAHRPSACDEFCGQRGSVLAKRAVRAQQQVHHARETT